MYHSVRVRVRVSVRIRTGIRIRIRIRVQVYTVSTVTALYVNSSYMLSSLCRVKGAIASFQSSYTTSMNRVHPNTGDGGQLNIVQAYIKPVKPFTANALQ